MLFGPKKEAAGNEEQKGEAAREYSRVDAHIPLEVRLVPQEERASLRSRIVGDTVLPEMRSLPDINDRLLNDWIKMLSAKLDAIINMLAYQREGFSSMSFNNVNLSGGGMGFTSKEKFNVADVLELKMMLPLLPPVSLYVYAEVVKVIPQTSSNNVVAVKFVATDEEVRDQIVKYVFKRQKDMLREKRK